MVSGTVIEARLTLHSPTKLVYTDDRHLNQEFEETIDADPLRTDTTKWLTDSLRRRVDFCDVIGLRLLGRYLYQKVFRGTIAKAFDETYDRFEEDIDGGRENTLRLVITFHPDAYELADLPWEFLYYVKSDGDGTFLSGEKHSLVLTRMVNSQPLVMNQPLPRKLHALVAVCTPSDLPSGVAKADIERINAATDVTQLKAADAQNASAVSYLKRLQLDERIQLKILADPTFSILQEAMGEKPDLIHFVGHGDPGALYMRRSDEQMATDQARVEVARSTGARPPEVIAHEKVDVTKVETLFREHQPVLAFLQACHGAALGRDVRFSTALEIVKTGVPAVVAMQYQIEAEGADKFALAFYKELMGGGTIADAVSKGRQAIAEREGSAWSHRDFGTPVVYIHGDTVVVAAPPPSVTSGEGSSQTPGQATSICPRCAQAYRYEACPKCKLHFRCQCAKATPPVCPCNEPLEIPENGWCAACCHDVDQPAWAGDAGTGTRVESHLPLRAVAATDGYQEVS